MPAQISHILAAEEALVRAAPRLAEVWDIRKGWKASEGYRELGPASWFRFGAQGPDIFYHNQRTKPSGIHYGVLAHKRNYGLAVEAMVSAIVEEGLGANQDILAWILGFSTHAAVDRAIHPFVVHFSGWQAPLLPESARFRSCHPFLERLLDIDILGGLRNRSIGACDLEALLPLDGRSRGGDAETQSLEASLCHIFGRGLKAAFPGAAGSDFLLERRILNAIADARYFLRVTNPSLTSSGSNSLLPWFDDRSGWRSMALIYPERMPEGLDVGNDSHEAWDHPAGDGRTSRKSHAELFEEGIAAATESLCLVLAAIESKTVEPGLGTVVGNGGLSITDEDGIPVPPRLSRPLPLKKIMEGEFQRRILAARDLATDSTD